MFLLTVFVVSLWYDAHATLVYDPVTNSFISQNTLTSNQVSQTNTSSSQNSIDEYDPTEISSIPVSMQPQQSLHEENDLMTEEEQENTDSLREDQDNQSAPEQTLEEVMWAISWQSRDWLLQYMHMQVVDNAIELTELLLKNYQSLQEQANDLLDESVHSRLQTLQCLWIVDSRFDYLQNINTTRTDLARNIAIITTDLHSSISALENKIEANLLTQLDRNLQIWSLQNKIDAYHAEFLNMLDMYYELSLEELNDADALIREESEEYLMLLEMHDKRVTLYNQVEKAYQDFLLQSSLSNDGSWPDLQSLLSLMRSLEFYYRAEFMDRWEREILIHIPLNALSFGEFVRNQARSAFAAYFAAQTDTILWWLYPLERMQAVHTRVVSLRGLYKQPNWTFDCRALIENWTIDWLWPRLVTDINNLSQKVQDNLLKLQAEGVVIPSSARDLEALLNAWLQAWALDELEALIAIEKARIERRAASEWVNWLPIGMTPEKIRWKGTIRGFIQQVYRDHLQNNNIDAFDQTMQRAYQRVNTALWAWPTWSTKVILDAIKEVIEEFM